MPRPASARRPSGRAGPFTCLSFNGRSGGQLRFITHSQRVKHGNSAWLSLPRKSSVVESSFAAAQDSELAVAQSRPAISRVFAAIRPPRSNAGRAFRCAIFQLFRLSQGRRQSEAIRARHAASRWSARHYRAISAQQRSTRILAIGSRSCFARSAFSQTGSS